jgi:hypothetical protein
VLHLRRVSHQRGTTEAGQSMCHLSWAELHWNMFPSEYFSFPCQHDSTIAPCSFIHLLPKLYDVSLPVRQFSPVSIIPSPLHTQSFIYHRRYTTLAGDSIVKQRTSIIWPYWVVTKSPILCWWALTNSIRLFSSVLNFVSNNMQANVYDENCHVSEWAMHTQLHCQFSFYMTYTNVPL